jgi:hypothetical protein
LTDESGKVRLEYPPSEARAHQIAQDAGATVLGFGDIKDVFAAREKRKA